MIDNVPWEERRIAQHFGEQLTKRAEELELSAWAVGHYSDLSESTIKKYMKGEYLPKTFIVARIASALECSVSDLLGC